MLLAARLQKSWSRSGPVRVVRSHTTTDPMALKRYATTAYFDVANMNADLSSNDIWGIGSKA